MAEKVLMKGNEAIAEAAIRAGCRHYFGYPITPQNEIPEYLSLHLPQVGGCFIQAEVPATALAGRTPRARHRHSAIAIPRNHVFFMLDPSFLIAVCRQLTALPAAPDSVYGSLPVA